MMRGINDSEHQQSMYHTNANINFMLESVIQIKSGKTTNVNATAKNTIYMKKIIFEILLHVVTKMLNTL